VTVRIDAIVGPRIRAARLAAGLSQPQLARLAEVADAMLCAWETGRTIPTINSLQRVADALGLPLSDFVGPV